MSEAYVTAALASELERVRAAAEGTRNDTLNVAAFRVGQLLRPGGGLAVDDVERQLVEAGMSTGLGQREAEATVHSGLRGGVAHPRDAPVPADGVLAGLGPLARRTGPMSYEDRLRRLDEELACERAQQEAPADEPAEPPSRFACTIRTRSQLRDLPRAEPLISGVLSRRSAALLVGSTGVGKTFLALSWACSVGTGTTWVGRAVHRCPALYVVGEGAAGLDARVDAWEQAWRTRVADTDVVFSVRPESLASSETWAELTAEATKRGVGFVVLDTMSSLAPDVDETRDAPTIIRRLADLAARIDGTALLVHHPGWSDSGRSRGGYALEANADEVLVAGEVTGSGDLIELHRKKVKEAEAGQRVYLRRRPFGESLIIETATGKDAEVPLRTRIVAILADMAESGATSNQLLVELGASGTVNRSTLTKALKNLTDTGIVATEGPRGRARYYLPDQTHAREAMR